MNGMDGWDIALLAVAGYLAIITLVRLMNRRRDRILEELTEEAQIEKKRLRAQNKKEESKKLHEQVQPGRPPRRDAA